MSDQTIAIHYQQMEEWLNDRRSVFGRKNKQQFEKLMSYAPQLVQAVQYDIPAVQKQVKRNANLLEECYRVCEEADRSQESLVEKREQFLALYDLQGAPPLGGDQDLQVCIDDRVERGCAALCESLQAYSRSHLHTFSATYEKTLAEISSGMYGQGSFAVHFPWLTRLCSEDALPTIAQLRAAGDDNGNTSSRAGADDTNVDDSGPQIDWGDIDLGAGGDVGGELSGAEAATAAPAVEIQWDAEEETVVVQQPEDDQLPEANNKTFSLDISRSRDRANLIAELQAAVCFASERARATNEVGASPFVTASQALLDELTHSYDALFARMKTNFRARDSFEDDVRRFHRMWTGVLSRKASHQSKAEELEAEVRRLEPQQEALLSTIRNLRDDCLTQLQLIFPDRKVMIVGDINKYI